jgi:hypothetical protein
VSVSTAVDRGCFGFRVQSPLELRYLRSGGIDALEILEGPEEPQHDPGELLREWLPHESRPVHVRLFVDKTAGRFSLWIADVGWYVVEPGNARIFVPPAERTVRREERLWGIPVILAFLERGDLPIHAGVVDVGGRAIAFGGPTKHGKTTLAAAFWRNGHRLLSEDLTCLRWDPDPIVIPGPAMLRPRVDVADRLGLTEVEEIDRDGDRVHLALGGPRARGHEAVPLAGIVLLREATDDISLSRVDLADAIRDLWVLTLHTHADDHERRMFEGITDLASKTAVWNLHRPKTLDALDDTIERIVEVVGHV